MGGEEGRTHAVRSVPFRQAGLASSSGARLMGYTWFFVEVEGYELTVLDEDEGKHHWGEL